jgi:hypothetical protein
VRRLPSIAERRTLTAIEGKYEQDIDLLLTEEFSVNHKFAEWSQREDAQGNEQNARC